MRKLNDIKELIARYNAGTANDEERHALEQWYAGVSGPDRSNLSDDKIAQDSVRRSILQGVTAQRPAIRKVAVRRWLPYAAAVAILLAVGTFLFLESRVQKQGERQTSTEILPGGNRAMLTLADGRIIDLSETQSGIVVGEDNSINYQDGSEVLNTDARSKPVSDSRQNQYILSTPKGGTYTVTLPDGSKVWLNASSTLKYPERFDGAERVVELEGEAYFEVVRSRKVANSQIQDGSVVTQQISASADQPFRVVSKGQTVEVLGTSFNISAYPDNSETKTTLVSGSVQLALPPALGNRLTRDKSLVLVPGEQGTTTGKGFSKVKVDTEPYTAWKDGKFVFEQEPLEDIMKTLARWYDVEIVYQGNKTYSTFTGSISRHENIEEILENIRFTQAVDFKIEGRRITIM